MVPGQRVERTVPRFDQLCDRCSRQFRRHFLEGSGTSVGQGYRHGTIERLGRSAKLGQSPTQTRQRRPALVEGAESVGGRQRPIQQSLIQVGLKGGEKLILH